MVDITKNSYDTYASLYDQKNRTGLANAYYERPAVLSLLPSNLTDKIIVDAGCGAGMLSQELEKRGAQLIAFDYSEGLIKIAQSRLKTTNIRVADLTKQLDFISTASADYIVSSLVLHYIKDWVPIFNEFNRILKSDGSVVFSIHHPHQDWYWFELKNYFQKILCKDELNMDGNKFTIEVYHRTLEEVFEVIETTKFYVEKLVEPMPLPAGQNIDPKFYENLKNVPRFLFLKLKKINS